MVSSIAEQICHISLFKKKEKEKNVFDAKLKDVKDSESVQWIGMKTIIAMELSTICAKCRNRAA